MQTTPMWNKVIVIGLVLCMGLNLASCAAYRYTTITPNVGDIHSTLEPGDTVRIVTKEGRDLEFPITFITSEAIEWEGHRVLFSDIATLEKRQISPVVLIWRVPLAAVGFAGSVVGWFVSKGQSPLWIPWVGTCCSIWQ